MKRKILCPLLALLLLICLATPAFAEEYTGGEWNVTFNGRTMESNFHDSDLSDPIRAIQPGDRITVQIGLKNEDTDATHWYMTNEVLQSFEDSLAKASGGAYTYHLSYFDPEGNETLIYSSDTVGGEGQDGEDSEGGKGLHQVTDSMDEFFYLDTLEPSEAASVQLTVALDGETQGNAYQDALAKLQMNFAVERAADGPTVDATPAPTTAPGATPAPTRRPGGSTGTGMVQTGDESHLGLWIALMVCSGAAVVFLLVFGRKSRKKEDDLHE